MTVEINRKRSPAALEPEPQARFSVEPQHGGKLEVRVKARFRQREKVA